MFFHGVNRNLSQSKFQESMSNPIVPVAHGAIISAKNDNDNEKKSGRADRERWGRKGRSEINPVSPL